MTSRSLALPAPSLALGRARGWHRRVATLLIRSRRQAGVGDHPLHQNHHLACKVGLERIVSKRLGVALQVGPAERIPEGVVAALAGSLGNDRVDGRRGLADELDAQPAELDVLVEDLVEGL